jgi:acetyl esterase
MEQNEKSDQQIKISKKMETIVRLSHKLTGKLDLSSATEQQIIDYNNRDLPNNRLRRKLLKKLPKNVEISTYIIPVSEGAITGYFFQKEGYERKQLTSLRPLIIYYHGGGWVLGDMEIYQHICARLAELTHADVLAIDYRLAPQHKFPIAVEDCYDTLLWAEHGARYWKVDPEQIYVMGDSAGGNLATVVTRLARDRKGPHIAGQILIYPVTDGRLRTPSYSLYKETPTLSFRDMQFFVKNYQSEPKDILNANFSPLLAKDHSRLPPALIITAQYDPLSDDGKFYAEALKSADTLVKHLEVKETIHGYFPYPDAKGSDETEAAIMQFIAGKPIENIELITKKELAKKEKRELRTSRKKDKSLIEVEIS